MSLEGPFKKLDTSRIITDSSRVMENDPSKIIIDSSRVMENDPTLIKIHSPPEIH